MFTFQDHLKTQLSFLHELDSVIFPETGKLKKKEPTDKKEKKDSQ